MRSIFPAAVILLGAAACGDDGSSSTPDAPDTIDAPVTIAAPGRL